MKPLLTVVGNKKSTNTFSCKFNYRIQLTVYVIYRFQSLKCSRVKIFRILSIPLSHSKRDDENKSLFWWNCLTFRWTFYLHRLEFIDLWTELVGTFSEQYQTQKGRPSWGTRTFGVSREFFFLRYVIPSFPFVLPHTNHFKYTLRPWTFHNETKFQSRKTFKGIKYRWSLHFTTLVILL